jgi:hypothetical protein
MDLSRVEFEHKFVKNLNDEDSKKELLDFFDNYSELQKQIVNLKKLSTNYQQERDEYFDEIVNLNIYKNREINFIKEKENFELEKSKYNSEKSKFELEFEKKVEFYKKSMDQLLRNTEYRKTLFGNKTENVILENHGSSYVESRGAPYNGNETIFTD